MRQWLRLPEALLFRRVLESAAVAAQITAGAKLACNPYDGDAMNKAQSAASIAYKYLAALDALEQFSKDDGKTSVPFETLTLTT